MFKYKVSYCLPRPYNYFHGVPDFGMIDVSVEKADDIDAILKAVSEKTGEECNNIVIINYFYVY